MVGRLRQLMQNPDITFRLRRRTEHSKTEILFAYYLRARKSKQDSTWFDFLKGNSVQLAITLQRIPQYIFMLGKSRRR